MKLRFVPAAKREVFKVLEERQQSLGSDQSAFLDDLQRTLGLVREYPLARPVVLGSTRRWELDRFPYAILYAVEPAEIVILAFGHVRRAPSYWLRRSRMSRGRA